MGVVCERGEKEVRGGRGVRVEGGGGKWEGKKTGGLSKQKWQREERRNRVRGGRRRRDREREWGERVERVERESRERVGRD